MTGDREPRNETQPSSSPIIVGREDDNILTPDVLEEDDAWGRYGGIFKACPQYLQDCPPESCSWVVEGLFPEGYLVILGGDSKSGKSCIVTEAAMAVACGRPFLGMPVRPGAVLWCAYEESEGERSSVLLEFDCAPPALYVTHEKIYIDTKDGIGALRWWIRRTGAKLIVIDPLYGATTVENLAEGRKARDVMAGLKELCRTERVVALVLHHVNKNVSAGQSRERFADSNQILAAASMDMLMEVIEGHGSREIRLKMHGRGAFANRTLVVHSEGVAHYELTGEGSSAKGSVALREKQIVECIENSEDALSAEDIAQATGLLLKTVQNELAKLAKKSRVRYVGKRGRAWLYGRGSGRNKEAAA